MITYYFDTYALVEIIFSNEKYLEKINNTSMVTTKINLLELYYHILVRKNKTDAEIAYAAFQDMVTDIQDDDVKAACMFRAAHKKEKLSFIDCLGYAMAKQRGIKFLTGDEAFRGMENVEFVK